MLTWAPPRDWEGQDSFLIGGGHSLYGFDFKRLIGKNTIGCNDAFRLGPEIVKFCIFGDGAFFQKNKWVMQKSGLRYVSNSPTLFNFKLPWIHLMHRESHGLWDGDKLGWNASTGAAAINLAISLGSKRIYLLGYDMNLVRGKSHWHSHRDKLTTEQAFTRFAHGFGNVQKDLVKYPGVEILNVTDGTSKLPHFRQINWEQFSLAA